MEENNLVLGEVISIQKVGEGTRVCVDCIDTLEPKEGALVGNTGSGYLLVLSENRETDTYPARPFRINCGAIHQYLSHGEKTNYLSELKSGQPIQVFNTEGKREVAIGRVKIEKRPLMRVECRINDTIISATLQQSDSVQLLTSDYEPKAIVDLEEGERIFCCEDKPGRHLGEKLNEYIMEY
ncbi:3-dehydroquinate synthase II [Bacillus tianshenii]|nr:3-dehydroquinate synthase II [Bacillus tianshenii]